MFACEFGDGGDIDDFEEWVAGSFDPDGFGIGLEGVGDELELGHIDEGEVETFFAEEAFEESVGAAVEVSGCDDVIAWGEECHSAVDSGHAGGGSDAAGTAFECGEVFFEGFSGGVTGAGVIVAGVGFE